MLSGAGPYCSHDCTFWHVDDVVSGGKDIEIVRLAESLTLYYEMQLIKEKFIRVCSSCNVFRETFAYESWAAWDRFTELLSPKPLAEERI